MTTENIVGEDVLGTTNEYLTNNFDRTGIAGKKTGIGKNKELGVFKV